MPKRKRKSAFGPDVTTPVDKALRLVSWLTGLIYVCLPFVLWCAFLIASSAVFLGFYWGVEALGNVLLIIGAVLIASGAVLSADTKKFFITIRNQENVSPTHYLRHTHLLRFVRHAIDLHAKGWSLLKIRRLYSRQLHRITTPGGVRSYLTQARAVDMLTRGSNRAEAGTFLIVVGTIILMWHSMKK